MFSIGDDVISIHQNIPNVGNSTFSAYCVKKSTWSEDEKSNISFLLQLIYVLFSRTFFLCKNDYKFLGKRWVNCASWW